MATEQLGPIVAQVLACAEAHLTNPVGKAFVMPGSTLVADNCCEGEGQLWVRIVSIGSALSNNAMQPCAPLYQVRLGIGAFRCAHTIDDQGNFPSAAEMTADAFLTYQDRADIIESLVCCSSGIPDLETMRILDWQPLGVDGGCVGGEVSVTFNYILCTPCDDGGEE